MQKSLKISFIGHFVILFISSITLPFLIGKVQAPLVISVDLIQIGDRTNIPYAPKVPDGEKTDKKTKDRVVTNQAPPKIVPKEKPDAVPLPENIKHIKDLLEKRQNPVKLENLDKQTSEFEKKKIFDPNKISALIDKSKKDNAEIEKKTSLEATQSQQKNVVVSKLTITQEDAIKSQIFKCWNIPIGLPYNENLTVKVRIKLNPDGSLISSEILDQSRMNAVGQNYYKILAESALRAVKLCNPLKVPPTEYEKWKEMQLNFDAREMLRG
jgi:outer membrane biosynthesis protein TonB